MCRIDVYKYLHWYGSHCQGIGIEACSETWILRREYYSHAIQLQSNIKMWNVNKNAGYERSAYYTHTHRSTIKKNTHWCRCEVARHDIEIRAGLIVSAAIVSFNGEGVVSGDASICDIRFIDAVWCETLPARSHRLTCKHQCKNCNPPATKLNTVKLVLHTVLVWNILNTVKLVMEHSEASASHTVRVRNFFSDTNR